MTTPLQKAAKALVDQHLPTYLNQNVAELRKALDAEIAQAVEPVAYWTPKGGQFCLPAKDGKRPFAKVWEPLYMHPPQPRVTAPAASWLIRKEPNTKDKYFIAEGNPPAKVLEIYGITQGEK